jgi:hypothetical protein
MFLDVVTSFLIVSKKKEELKIKILNFLSYSYIERKFGEKEEK